MKCQYCGGNLSLEAERCPHCGELNIHAQQHIKDMHRYQGAFESTQSHIYKVARNYSGITARAVIISALLILIVIFAIISAEMYSIKYGMREREAGRKAKQFREQLDEYLAEENYLAFSTFCDSYNISGYSDAFEEYRPIINASKQYTYLYRDIMQLYTADEDYIFESRLDSVGRGLEYFYKYMDDEEYSFGEAADTEETRQILAQMEESMRALLIVYCNITEEEALQLKEMSPAKRMVLLEESIQYEE
ncbi:MAG: hypothetical protein E7291_05705 [Lachnospiraceae bacterium]|nr:hypothetical protein [Lachnospiraceae bacterium]